MNNYRVIWFDDEHESLNIIREKAYLENIELVGFTNAKQGIDELEQNISMYDAAIIDGIFYTTSEQSGYNTNDKALLNVALALERLASKKKLPWFILSGQDSFTKNTNPFAEGLKNNKVYDKLNNSNLDELWRDIKFEADKHIETQLRLKYYRVFELCSEKYLGVHVEQELFRLLRAENEDTVENHFNSIRKVIEDLFVAFNKFGLLPSDFVKPNVALNQSSIFLSGQEQYEKTDAVYKQYKHLEDTYLPKQISYYLRSILNVTQAGSHRSEIDLHLRTVKTPYLFKSVLFQLLDVLVWFKIYIDSGPKKENWIKIENSTEVYQPQIELISGTVINLNTQKGFAFFKPDAGGDNIYIPAKLVAFHSLSAGMVVKVEVEEYTDEGKKELKQRVRSIEC
ncbi:MAG: hypothetical protein L6Q78_07975 [Bacteroidia bacterium]|nr:hypothetical protein [Bacteroidia bacterium]